MIILHVILVFALAWDIFWFASCCYITPFFTMSQQAPGAAASKPMAVRHRSCGTLYLGFAADGVCRDGF